MKLKPRNDLDFLFSAIMSLKNCDECYAFFEDVCTIKELDEISQRLEVAKLLWQGKSYNEVNQQTGASTATICRVKKCLNDETSGYQLVFNNLLPQEGQK